MQIVDFCTKMSQDDIKERFQLKNAATTVTTATRSAMFSFQMLQIPSKSRISAAKTGGIGCNTLEQNWIIGVTRWELNPVNVQLNQLSDVR